MGDAQCMNQQRGGRRKFAVIDGRNAKEECRWIFRRMHDQTVLADKGVKRAAQKAEAALRIFAHFFMTAQCQ